MNGTVDHYVMKNKLGMERCMCDLTHAGYLKVHLMEVERMVVIRGSGE